MDQFWRIGEFAKKVGKHTNTVDGWFKQLEEKRVHYVGRAGNEKVYDELDLAVAEFIRDRREQKPSWALEAVFAVLPEQFDLRPFPVEMETITDAQVLDIEVLRKAFRAEFQAMAEQAAATAVLALPSPEQLRSERVSERLTERRIERRLEREALDQWSAKPENERIRRIGLFRKEENIEVRDRFIRDYVDQHFEARFREVYDLQ